MRARLLFKATAPAGGTCKGKACWSSRGAKGFRYRDKEATPNGLTAVDLGAAGNGKAKVMVAGKGANLHLPALGATPPLTTEVDTGGACFGATFPSARPNKSTHLAAKGN